MKRVTWEEKLQRLEEGEATPLRRSARISQPPERSSWLASVMPTMLEIPQVARATVVCHCPCTECMLAWPHQTHAGPVAFHSGDGGCGRGDFAVVPHQPSGC
ncbi:hypothetical protein CLOP_g8551 [Closterium sp. NIES-67]|nr:hypothetical protein CLOP_g8551 [Closterium sp. NIES-67]